MVSTQTSPTGTSMHLFEAIVSGFRNYAEFRGEARRSEFWFWMLFVSVGSLAASTLDAEAAGGYFVGVWLLGLALPTIAMAVRRLRNAGLSWVFLCILPIPVVGAAVVTVLLCLPSRSLAADRMPAA